MDENKEILGADLPEADEAGKTADAISEETAEALNAFEKYAEAEAAGETNEEAAGEAAEEAAEAGEAGGSDEAFELSEEYDPTLDGQEKPEKKKCPIMQPIMVAMGIVLAAAIATIAVSFFLNNGITGKWHMMFTYNLMSDATASPDEPQTVDVDYSFDFRDDGTVTSAIGTLTSKGSYTCTKTEDGKMQMTLDLLDPATKGSFYGGPYNVETSGNIFTGRTFKLTVEGYDDFAYNFDKKSVDVPKLERPEDFKRLEKLEGTWISQNEMMSYKYTFDKDGKATYNIHGSTFDQYTYSIAAVDLTFECVYSPADNSAKLTYYFTEPVDMEIGYQFKDDNTLIIGGNTFTREGASTEDSGK